MKGKYEVGEILHEEQASSSRMCPKSIVMIWCCVSDGQDTEWQEWRGKWRTGHAYHNFQRFTWRTSPPHIYGSGSSVFRDLVSLRWEGCFHQWIEEESLWPLTYDLHHSKLVSSGFSCWDQQLRRGFTLLADVISLPHQEYIGLIFNNGSRKNMAFSWSTGLTLVLSYSVLMINGQVR